MTIKGALCAIALAVAAFAGVASATAGENVDPFSASTKAVESARATMMEDPAKAYEIGKRLHRKHQNDPKTPARSSILSRAAWITGEAANRMGKTKEAEKLINLALRLARAAGDKRAEADALLSKGAINQDSERVAEALQSYLAAAAIFQETQNPRSQSITLQYLASLYAEAADYERAERYYREALQVYSAEPKLLVAMANNHGNLLTMMKKYSEATEQYRKGAEIARSIGSNFMESRTLSNMARSLAHDNKPLQAKKALAMSRQLSDDKDSIELKMTAAVVAFNTGNPSEAVRIIEQMSKELGSKMRSSQYHDLNMLAARAYAADGNWKTAFSHLMTVKQIREDMTSVAISTKNALMASQFDYANQEIKIQRLKTKELERNIALQAQTARTIKFAFIAAMLTIAVIITLLSVWLVTMRRSRNRIAAINTNLEQALHEVSEREKAEMHATMLAEHDALTGLPNRRHLYAKLFPEMCDGLEDGQECIALLLDLDRFKPINDVYGHDTGDVVLSRVADRLREISENYGAVPVRLGGDEFVVMLRGNNGDDRAEKIAQDMIDSISSPYDIGDRRLLIGTSIGIARYPTDSETVEDLLRSADIAMYEAKRGGRKTFRRFDSDMVIKICERAETESDLRVALKEGQITAHFQPVHCYDRGRTAGFEALARWKHPVRGMIPPDEFIPIAEETGMIDELTMGVLRDACRAARQWPDEICVSVNISPMLLRDAWITTKIFGVLASEGLPGRRLIIEITENAVIDDLDLAAEVISAFRSAGIRIALDDFGKGYSSLSHLRQLDFDYIKLDAAFVTGIGDGESMKITTAVGGLAKALDMPVTAEGVENEETAVRLRELGFNYGQGYLYGKAMPVEEATAMIMLEAAAAVSKAA